LLLRINTVQVALAEFKKIIKLNPPKRKTLKSEQKERRQREDHDGEACRV